MLHGLDVARDKPILLQVSRFGRFKVPVAAYLPVKGSHDCYLAGGTATDDRIPASRVSYHGGIFKSIWRSPFIFRMSAELLTRNYRNFMRRRKTRYVQFDCCFKS